MALLFDMIAATTVYGLVGKFVYAILTFAAGFAPLLMHEFLYTRAYANSVQKILAVIGAGVSVVMILTVGVIAGVINVLGFAALSTQMLEIALIVALVLVAGLHGLIAAIYFYIYDGIKANQVRAESVAYHERRIEDINRAKEILALAEKGANDEDEILGQLRGDAITQKEEPVVPQPATRKIVVVNGESGAAELQPVPLSRSLPPEELTGAGFLTGMGSNGNGRHPNGTK